MMNSLKKMIAVVVAFTMISGTLLVMVPSTGQSSEVTALPYAEQIPTYAEEEVRERTANELTNSGLVLPTEEVLADNIPLNTTRTFVTQDTALGSFYEESMTKRGEAEHCEVWVADVLTFYDPADLRNNKVDITDDQVEYIMDEFDDNIYPIMTETFTDAPALNGSEPDMSQWQYIYDDENLTEANVTDLLFPTNDTGKMMIMIFNIRDVNYYLPSYGSYVVGFYWTLIRDMYNRNVMHIDCYDWLNRTTAYSDRPFVYESTVAHEYQHLLHAETDPDEDTWVNEGLSMISEFLCGYGLPVDPYMIEFFLYPENSLTVWGDMGDEYILSDYGAVLMFMLYMYDHYGGKPMMQAIFFSDLQGIESIDDALLDLGNNRMSFDRVFRDWRMANLLMDSDVGGGLYSYNSVSWTDLPSGVWMNEYYATDDEFVRSDVYGMWGNPLICAYGTDYVWVGDLQDMDPLASKFVFDGDDRIQDGWQLLENELLTTGPSYPEYWWSGDGDEIDNLLTMDLNLSTPALEGDVLHQLDITTTWNIEEDWDYGFVQVSTDDGATWTSLDDIGAYCSDDIVPDGMPSIAENMPGLTGTSGWTELSFDLSAYDGQEILVGFRYMTDWGTNLDGWYIAEVAVDGEDVALEDLDAPVQPEADFLVTIFAYDHELGYLIMDIPVLDYAETAEKLMGVFMDYDSMIVLISPNAGPVDYMLDVEYRDSGMPR